MDNRESQEAAKGKRVLRIAARKKSPSQRRSMPDMETGGCEYKFAISAALRPPKAKARPVCRIELRGNGSMGAGMPLASQTLLAIFRRNPHSRDTARIMFRRHARQRDHVRSRLHTGSVAVDLNELFSRHWTALICADRAEDRSPRRHHGAPGLRVVRSAVSGSLFQ